MSNEYDWEDFHKLKAQKNKERSNKWKQTSYRRHLENNRRKARDRHRRYVEELKPQAFSILGGGCWRLSVDCDGPLDIDHIEPLNGRKREAKTKIWRKVVAGDKDFQLLCVFHHREKTAAEANGGRPRTAKPLPPVAPKIKGYHCSDPSQRSLFPH